MLLLRRTLPILLSLQLLLVCDRALASVDFILLKYGPNEIDASASEFTYRVVVRHAAAQNIPVSVTVTDMLPDEFDLASASHPSCQQVGRIVTCALSGALPGDTVITLVLRPRVDLRTRCFQKVDNSARMVVAPNAKLPTPKIVDSSHAEAQIVCRQCSDGIDNDGDGGIDLSDPQCSSRDDDDEGGGEFVFQKQGPAVVRPGDLVTYSLTFRNNKSRVIDSISLSDDSNPALEPVSANPLMRIGYRYGYPAFVVHYDWYQNRIFVPVQTPLVHQVQFRVRANARRGGSRPI